MRIGWAAPCIVALIGCGRETAPSIDASVAERAPPPPTVPSRFSVPLDYDIGAVLRLVDRVVPRTFGSIDSVHRVGDDDRRHYAFQAERGDFTAFADGRLVHLRATLEYRARGFFKPFVGPTISLGCGDGEERPRIVIELATPLSLTSDWHLSSHAELVRLEPPSDSARDRCNVSLLRYDVTGRVVEAARGAITAHLRDIDRKVSEVDLRSRFADLWALLARPIQLTEGVWLMLAPEKLLMGQVNGSEHILTVPVTLVADPVIVTSATAPAIATTALPALGRDSAKGGFRVSLDGVVDYELASSVITLALADKQITQSGHSVTPKKIVVAPTSAGRLSVTMAFTGDATGELRLVGTPVFDAAHREITVPDLDYDLVTDNKLIKTYAWLRSDALRGTLRQKAHVPVDQALSKGRELLLLGLNRTIGDVLTLSAVVDSVGVENLFVTRSGVVVRALATGQAKVSVHQR